jgi:hypothetical protein
LSNAVYRVCKSIASMSSRLCTLDTNCHQQDSGKPLQQRAPSQVGTTLPGRNVTFAHTRRLWGMPLLGIFKFDPTVLLRGNFILFYLYLSFNIIYTNSRDSERPRRRHGHGKKYLNKANLGR